MLKSHCSSKRRAAQQHKAASGVPLVASECSDLPEDRLCASSTACESPWVSARARTDVVLPSMPCTMCRAGDPSSALQQPARGLLWDLSGAGSLLCRLLPAADGAPWQLSDVLCTSEPSLYVSNLLLRPVWSPRLYLKRNLLPLSEIQTSHSKQSPGSCT